MEQDRYAVDTYCPPLGVWVEQCRFDTKREARQHWLKLTEQGVAGCRVTTIKGEAR